MRRSRSITAFAASTLALAACAHHQSLSPLPAPQQGHTMASATLQVRWTPKSTGSSAVRHARWISPSAKSVAVEVNGDPSLTTIADKPAQGSVSTITIKAPAGTDAITISVWDASGATGNELGQANLSATIAAGQANTISATLDGVVASIDFTPLPNQPNLKYLTTSMDSTGAVSYSMVGDFAVTFAATPKDADGNVIVSGAPVTATSTSSSIAVSAVSGQTNQFTVQPVGAPTRSSGILLKSSDASGMVQNNYPFRLVPIMIVAYENGGSGLVSAIDTDDGTQVPLPGTFSGVTAPVGMTQDTDNHRILVLDGNSGTIFAYHSDGTAVTEFPGITVSGATALTYDDNRHQIYVATADGHVKAFSTDGTPVQLSGAFQDLIDPVGIAYMSGPKTLGVVDAVSGTFNFYDEDGGLYNNGDSTIAEHPLNGLTPVAIASDNGASIYVSGRQALPGGTRGGGSVIDQVSLFSLFGGTVAVQNNGLASPGGMFFNESDGDIYVANADGTIAIFDEFLSGVVRTIPAPQALTQPTALLMVY